MPGQGLHSFAADHAKNLILPKGLRKGDGGGGPLLRNSGGSLHSYSLPFLKNRMHCAEVLKELAFGHRCCTMGHKVERWSPVFGQCVKVDCHTLTKEEHP